MKIDHVLKFIVSVCILAIVIFTSAYIEQYLSGLGLLILLIVSFILFPISLFILYKKHHSFLQYLAVIALLSALYSCGVINGRITVVHEGVEECIEEGCELIAVSSQVVPIDEMLLEAEAQLYTHRVNNRDREIAEMLFEFDETGFWKVVNLLDEGISSCANSDQLGLAAAEPFTNDGETYSCYLFFYRGSPYAIAYSTNQDTYSIQYFVFSDPMLSSMEPGDLLLHWPNYLNPFQTR